MVIAVFSTKSNQIADIALNDLIALCIIIDVSNKAHESYLVSTCDINEFESRYGLIPPKAIVIIYSEWDRF